MGKHSSAAVMQNVLLTNFALQQCQSAMLMLSFCTRFGGAGGTEGSSALCHTK